MPRVLRLVLAATVLMATYHLAAAQRTPPQAQRPGMGIVADTFDFQAFLDYGADVFRRDPSEALAAFSWAARLNPQSADAAYGVWAASVASQRGVLWSYIDRSRRSSESVRELRALDSLQLRALMLNPFPDRKFDHAILGTYVQMMNRQEGARAPSSPDLDYSVSRYISQADVATKAWALQGWGQFDEALRQYDRAIASSQETYQFHLERGRIFGVLGARTEAIAEFQTALQEMRKKDPMDLHVLYDSKAMAEHSIGVLCEQVGDLQCARDAYRRALAEDIAFYPAHVRLGLLAHAARDTAVALHELGLAVQESPNDAYLRHVYGGALESFGRPDEALTQLRVALQLAPQYALPHVSIAQAFEAKGEWGAARGQYEAFLVRAGKQDLMRNEVEQRLAALADRR